MAVSPDVTHAIMKEELTLVKQLARTYKWGVIPDYEKLTVTVTMYSHLGDLFIVEAICDNYKEHPPLFEFIDPDTGERGTANAYPKSHDSLFHSSGPCICAPFNRKAYKSLFNTGPHSDWVLGDWISSTANNYNWANHTKLGDMFNLIQTRIVRPDYFKGRMK